MQLVKQNINMCRKKKETETQISVNEDLNLQEYKPDIMSIISEDCRVLIDKTKALNGKVEVQGRLKYCVLYATEEGIDAFVKETSITESINIENIDEHDEVRMEITDNEFQAKLINSRKLNVMSVIGIKIVIYECYPESIVSDIENSDNIQKQFCDISALKLVSLGRDILRYHNQTQLPKDKSNIKEVLYENIVPRELDFKTEEAYISVRGRIHVFILFKPEQGSVPCEWFEYEYPLEEKINCNSCSPGMISDINARMYQSDYEIKNDAEEEARVISTDGAIEIEMMIYDEEQINALCDAYAINKKLCTEYRPILIPQLQMKKNAECRVVKRMKLSDESNRILQICNTNAEAKIENISVQNSQMSIKGHVFVKIVYITSDENQPLRVAKGSFEFEHITETDGFNEKCDYRVTPVIYSVSGNMTNENEIEIRVHISLNMIIFNNKGIYTMEECKLCDISKEELRAMPSVTVYMAQKDETLWDVSKKYLVSEDVLRETNKLGSDKISAGQKLIIVKNIAKV